MANEGDAVHVIFWKSDLDEDFKGFRMGTRKMSDGFN